MRYAFVLNPAARNGRASRRKEHLVEAVDAAGMEYTILETTAPRHATELAKEATTSHDVVVAVGGDGTVQEVAKGVIGTGTTMGILPSGTGNDFAQAIGMPSGMNEAIRLLQSSPAVSVDVGRLSWKNQGSDEVHEGMFTNCIGTGFDALAAQATGKYKGLGGKLAYIAAVLETLWKWRKPDAEVTVIASPEDGLDLTRMIHQGQFFLIEIDNGFSVGGGFLLTPDAEIDDGLFDVCFVEHISVPRALQLMPKTFSGKHVTEPEVQMLRTKHISVESTAPLPVQADGEILTTEAVSLDVEIIPNALNIIAPEVRKPKKNA